jgi:hypothetical protein
LPFSSAAIETPRSHGADLYSEYRDSSITCMIGPTIAYTASATRLSAAPRWERLRDHGHGRRPSPTQTAPQCGRSRDYLVGGGRSASHVPYPDLAGRHRGQAAIGATGVTGAALNSLFYRSRVQPGTVTSDASWLHRVLCVGVLCLLLCLCHSFTRTHQGQHM